MMRRRLKATRIDETKTWSVVVDLDGRECASSSVRDSRCLILCVHRSSSGGSTWKGEGWLSVRLIGFLVGWSWTVSLGSLVGWRFAVSLRFQVGWHFAVSLDFLVG